MSFFQTDNEVVNQQAGGVGELVLDVRGRSVNVFTRQVLVDLDRSLDRVAGEHTITSLVIRSNKPTGFLAGADLHEFTRIATPQAASDLSAQGQRVFDKVA